MPPSTLPPPFGVPVFDPASGTMTEPWRRYYLSLSDAPNTYAPINAQFLVATADPVLVNERNLGALATGFLFLTVAAGIATPSTTLSGAGLVNLNANELSSGTVPLARLSGLTNAQIAAAAAIAFSKLADGSALSVLGVATNASGANASIAAATDHQVLRRLGAALAFGAVNLASAAAVTGTLPVANGGTGFDSPRLVAATVFETAGRFGVTVVAGGVATFGTNGLELTTSATISSSAIASLAVVTAANGGGVFVTVPAEWSASFSLDPIGTDVQAFIGLGLPTTGGAGITFTANHIGFKITRAASGASNLTATQADGTTETASATLTTVAAGDQLGVAMRLESGSVAYYWRKNGGAWSAATTLTTNIPTAAQSNLGVAISNAGVATATTLTARAASYSR